ncbi:MAG: cobalamin-dependent protein [Dehalococcoidia bacterium]|nr:cobalamin-dependent protein [Dehalococcoidia bacterium]
MSELSSALANLEEEKVARIIKQELGTGKDSMGVLTELRKGMDEVGQRYKKGEYFLSELIVSGEIFKDAMKVLEPTLKKDGGGPATKVVIGTVKGDIHNIGKDIVATLLKGVGFEVYDLGIDVPVKAFVDKVVETKATIVGMSGLLTPSFESMKETVDALKEAGLRNKVKVIIGGGVVTELVQRHTGADAFTDDAMEGVEIIKKWSAKSN